MLGVFSYAQGTLTVTGQIAVVTSPVNITMNYENNGVMVTSTFATDSNGYFIDTNTIQSNQGYLEIFYSDCNGTLLGDSGWYVNTPTNGLFYDFGTLDYCPNGSNQTFVTGVFQNATGAINYSVSLDFGATYQNFTTSPNGIFSEGFSGITGQGVVFLMFTDCNNNTILDSAFDVSSNTTQEIYNFSNLNYCPPLSNTYFNILGSFDTANVVPFTITYGANQNISGTSDSFGNFNLDSIVVGTIPNFVVISFTDCNGNFVTDTAWAPLTLPFPPVFDFGLINYCSSNPTNNSLISGYLSPAAQNIAITLVIDSQTVTVLTNPNGYFSYTFQGIVASNYVYLSFTDCNNNLVTNSTTNISSSPTSSIFDFNVLNYCPTVSCMAAFMLSQNVIIDSLGNVISTGNVMIIDSSFGQNLTYTWDFGDGSALYTGTNFTHTYVNNGPYLLCLTVDNGAGCTDTYCDSIMVNANGVLTGKTNAGFTIQMGNGDNETAGPTSINTLGNQTEVTVYPNPASDKITLSFEAENAENMIVSIYSLTGQRILENNISAKSGLNQKIINVENLETGVYILKLKSSLGFVTKTLSIK